MEPTLTSDHAIDDELAELSSGLAVVGVDGADQAGVEGAGDMPELDGILHVHDRGPDEGLFDRTQSAAESRGPMFQAVGVTTW